MLINLSEYRKGNEALAAVMRKQGIAIGIGLACDAINALKAEKTAMGTGSTGYWEALTDMNTKLADELRRLK